MRLVLELLFPILLLVLLSTTTTNAHNITRILAKHPEFSTFNHYLTITHLAGEINRRRTITVCAVDNAAMSELLDKNYNTYTIKNILSLHVFADYFGAKKLHQITKGSTTTSTLFQATGQAAGTSGYVNITDIKGGKVGFSAGDNDGHLTAKFVKSIEELPYNISVIQISHILSSPEAAAPVAAPTDLNLTTFLSKQGCIGFSDLLISSGAVDLFTESVETGLTIFCPKDEALDSFTPRYKNLTKAGKIALLAYHGIPVYQNLGMLRSSNGVTNTLATEGNNKYDFTIQNVNDDVKLKTKVVTATVKGTLIDEEPLVVYKIDKVLMPRELFKGVVIKDADAEAPDAKAPKGSKGSKGSKDADADSPGPSSDENFADQTADDNAASGINSALFVSVVSVLISAIFMSN